MSSIGQYREPKTFPLKNLFSLTQKSSKSKGKDPKLVSFFCNLTQFNSLPSVAQTLLSSSATNDRNQRWTTLENPPSLTQTRRKNNGSRKHPWPSRRQLSWWSRWLSWPWWWTWRKPWPWPWPIRRRRIRRLPHRHPREPRGCPFGHQQCFVLTCLWRV